MGAIRPNDRAVSNWLEGRCNSFELRTYVACFDLEGVSPDDPSVLAWLEGRHNSLVASSAAENANGVLVE